MGNELPSSLGSSANGILLTFLQYADARLHLLRLEAGEITGGVFRNLVLIAAGALALALAYTFLIASGLILLSKLTDLPWEWILGIAGITHLLAGIILVAVAINRLRLTKAFTESLNEFQKDRQWLAKNHPPSPESDLPRRPL